VGEYQRISPTLSCCRQDVGGSERSLYGTTTHIPSNLISCLIVSSRDTMPQLGRSQISFSREHSYSGTTAHAYAHIRLLMVSYACHTSLFTLLVHVLFMYISSILSQTEDLSSFRSNLSLPPFPSVSLYLSIPIHFSYHKVKINFN